MNTLAWFQGLNERTTPLARRFYSPVCTYIFIYIFACMGIFMAMDVSASEQPQMQLAEHGIELTQTRCEYGRGVKVTNSLKTTLIASYQSYLAKQARLDLANILTKQTSGSNKTRVDSVAAINFEHTANLLATKQQQLDYSDTFWQGNETCLTAQLILTPSSQKLSKQVDINWNDTPATIWQLSQASVKLADIAQTQNAEATAMQQALKNAVADNIQLVAEQGAGKFALLKQHANKIQLSDIQSLFSSWKVLSKQQTSEQYNIQMLVSLDSTKLQKQLSRLVKKIAASRIYINAEPFTLKRQLITLLTAHNLVIASSANQANIQLTAKASMIAQANGYQNLIEIEVKNKDNQTIWQWQNDPGLITVSSNQVQQMNQLIQAHMSLPKQQKLIQQQLEYLLIEQALNHQTAL